MNLRRIRLAALLPMMLLACAPAAAATIQVIKSATCGCCNAWVEHLRKEGLVVKVSNVDDPAAAARALGVPDHLLSCHTGRIGGYVIEGHVPAADIKRLLAEKPKAIGIAVPGMPLGSPGMDQGRTRQAYNVILFDKGGKQRIFARH